MHAAARGASAATRGRRCALLAPLPPEKQAALDRLGYGLLNKVALFFDRPFWKHASNFFGRVVPNPKQRGKYFLFFNLQPASGHPVLLALAAGEAAAELEELDDEAVTKQAVDALRSMFGERQVPTPLRPMVTRWGSDKFARGSYSYVHVGASGQDYTTLGEPIGERLHFAGEHAIQEHPATVVGRVPLRTEGRARAAPAAEGKSAAKPMSKRRSWRKPPQRPPRRSTIATMRAAPRARAGAEAAVAAAPSWPWQRRAQGGPPW